MRLICRGEIGLAWQRGEKTTASAAFFVDICNKSVHGVG